MSYTDQTVRIGDPVTIAKYSDCQAAVVISKTRTQLKVQECNQHLLNGPNSGEPDALQCSAGGFAAYVTGTQRWDVDINPEGAIHKFTWRNRQQRYVLRGDDPRTGDFLFDGWRPHYDFNF